MNELSYKSNAQLKFPKKNVESSKTEFLSLPYLLKQLQSASTRVQIWAAHHLTEKWYEHSADFVGQLIESNNFIIKEYGIYLAGRQKHNQFAFPIFRIFNSSEDSLKNISLNALAEMRYSALETPLWNWLEQLLSSNEVNMSALQAATQNLLLFNQETTWWELNKKVPTYYNQHIKSLALFEALCMNLQTADQLAQALQHYAIYREQFTDPQFMKFFLDVFENQEIIDFIRHRMNYGYSIRLIYQECLNILGWVPSQAFVDVLEKIELNCKEQKIEQLPTELISAIRLMFPEQEQFLEEHFLEQFKEILSSWSSTIIKIQDQEYFFLLSLPLIRFLKEAEKECLLSPDNNTTRIARIYHSPFLHPQFMTQIINLLAGKLSINQSTPAFQADIVYNLPKEALWLLVSGQSGLENFMFSNILPRPWKYEIPFLVPKLIAIYKEKFEQLLVTSQHDEIHYALELFKRQPDDEILELTIKHFPFLINQHFQLFYEFIEHVADLRFIGLLSQHYRNDEDEIHQLIELLCEIHQSDNPLSNQITSASTSNDNTYIRILCPECHTSYRYSMSVLYYDYELLEQRRLFTNKDIWTTDHFSCKNCSSALPLKVEPSFLAQLYSDMLTARLLKLSEEEQKELALFKSLSFPKYFGKKVNPGIFLKKVNADLNTNRFSSSEQCVLLTELGKLYLAIDNLDDAQEAFRKSLDLVGDQPLALFNLGCIAYRQKNIHNARLHFSRFIQLFSKNDFDVEEGNLYDLALHYLEIIDKREYKRSTFQLIIS